MNKLPGPDVALGGNKVHLRIADRGVLCRGMCLHAIRPAAESRFGREDRNRRRVHTKYPNSVESGAPDPPT